VFVPQVLVLKWHIVSAKGVSADVKKSEALCLWTKDCTEFRRVTGIWLQRKLNCWKTTTSNGL